MLLSFDVTAQEIPFGDPYDRDAEPVQCLALDAWPLVNGLPPIARPNGYVFDIVSVLARGLEPSEFDPYTCSCGAAGCVGIHQNVVLESDEHEVRWVFPEKPFRAEFDAALSTVGEPLVLRFGRAQYEAALAEVEGQLLARAEASQLPVVVGLDREPENGALFRENLASAREYTLQYIADRNHRFEIFGKLMDTFVTITFPCGQRYTIAVSHLAYTLADRISEANGVDRDEPLEDEVLPRLHSGHDAILAEARALSWSEVESIVWYDSSVEQEHVPLTEFDMAEQWAGAQFEVCYRPD